MRWRRIAIAGLVLVILMVTVVQPKRADAFVPLLIPVVGGMELAATVFTGLATLATGIGLVYGMGEIEQSQAEEVVKRVTTDWDNAQYLAMRERMFGDAITWGMASPTDTTTVTLEPEVLSEVKAVNYDSFLRRGHFSLANFYGTWGFFVFYSDAPYAWLINGQQHKYLAWDLVGDQSINLKITGRPTNSVYDSMGGIEYTVHDVPKTILDIKKESDFFDFLQKYVPVVDASTGTPVVPDWQDVYPRITNPDRPRDIAVPTGMFKAYPKDIYGQADAQELTYRQKTKDYISNDGLVYPAADVIVAVPIPRVNDKGDVGVATPAGDWLSVRPGNPPAPDVVNPDIPGAGAPAIPIPGVDNPVIPGLANPVIPGVSSPAIPGVVNPAIPVVANPAIPAIPELTETSTSERINWEPLRLAGDALTRKFPFSVPWDLKRQLDVFDVAPQAPKFAVDKTLMVLAGHSIPLKMTIDLSHFDMVAAITRWFLVIAFDAAVILSMRRFMPE